MVGAAATDWRIPLCDARVRGGRPPLGGEASRTVMLVGSDDQSDTGRDEAIRVVLSGLASNVELEGLIGAVGALHRPHDTYPGEVMLELCAEVFADTTAAGAGPIPYEGLREVHLADYELVGKQNDRFRFAVHCSASIAGGLEPDLGEELYWWKSDDFWRYVLLALVAVVRASAALRGLTVEELAERLGERHGVSVAGTE